MTTKPEGPQSRSMQRKIALQKGEPMPTCIPATPAPEGPAQDELCKGCNLMIALGDECEAVMRGDYWYHGACIHVPATPAPSRCPQCGSATCEGTHMSTTSAAVPPTWATPAPSQPAGVREFYRDVYKRTPTSHEGYLQFAEAYARQQTAAKDAELADANQRVDFQRTQILDLDAAVERQTALKKSAERERDSLRESLQRIRDLHGTDAMVRKLASDALAGKE